MLAGAHVAGERGQVKTSRGLRWLPPPPACLPSKKTTLLLKLTRQAMRGLEYDYDI
jgi:hypothetical protein